MQQGLSKTEAQACSIAAQIWAEMLGMVCHPEYYKLGEQKVSIHYLWILLIVGVCGSYFWVSRVTLFRYVSP